MSQDLYFFHVALKEDLVFPGIQTLYRIRTFTCFESAGLFCIPPWHWLARVRVKTLFFYGVHFRGQQMPRSLFCFSVMFSMEHVMFVLLFVLNWTLLRTNKQWVTKKKMTSAMKLKAIYSSFPKNNTDVQEGTKFPNSIQQMVLWSQGFRTSKKLLNNRKKEREKLQTLFLKEKSSLNTILKINKSLWTL